MSDNKWTPEPELYVNLWEGYDKGQFLESLESVIEDKKTALNPDQFLGTYKLVSIDYLETILKQREELAEQVKKLTQSLSSSYDEIDSLYFKIDNLQ